MLRIFKHSATGDSITLSYIVVAWMIRSTVVLYSAVEEFCDNAVIYFIAPSLRLVWSLPLCTSLSVYISRQILSSRRLGFREQAPLFTHTSHVCACASFVSMERCCQMPFSFKPLVLHKVNRCLARYSPRATTTNQMSWQGLAQNEQKCHF